jgi:O-acetyl-ADP-ribose deacetylase (regulator of RNase III)
MTEAPPPSGTGSDVADVGPVALEPPAPFVLPPLPGDRRARRYRADPLTVDLVEGTLPDLGRKVDAIVSSDDNYLSHTSGVSAALWRAAGHDFAATQARLARQLILGEVHVTTAGFLPARFIFHAVTIDLNLDRAIIPAHLPIVYRKVLRTAREHDCVSLAMPLLAAGAAEISPTLSATALAHAVRTSSREGPLRHLLLYALPEIFDTVAPVLDHALAERRRLDPRWWIGGALTYLPIEDARALQRSWRSLPTDTDWRAAVAGLLEDAVQRAHRRINETPGQSAERLRGSIAEVRMVRGGLEHGSGRLTYDELAGAGKALRDLGDSLSALGRSADAPTTSAKRAAEREGGSPRQDEPGGTAGLPLAAGPGDEATDGVDDGAGAVACRASMPEPARYSLRRREPPLPSASAPAPASPAPPEPEPTRALAPLPEIHPDAEGGTTHVRALHRLLLERLPPHHLEALGDILEKQGYRGDRDFRLLEHLVREDPARLLRQFFSVFDLRAILERDYGLRPAPDLSHRQAAALVLRQLGFQPPRRPRGLLAAQAATRDAVSRVRVLQAPGTRLRGDVVEIGAQLEYVCHVLLRFVCQVLFDCPPEVLLREKLDDGGLDKAGLGQLFSLVECLDGRARREAAPRLELLGFSPRPLLPEHGKGLLPEARNHVAHSRVGRRLETDADLARGRRFLEEALAFIDYVAEPQHRIFPLMIVVRSIHYDRWGRRKVSAETESGEREHLFTDRPLRPGEAYMMRPLSNPLRVDPLLVPAGDLGLVG